MNKKKLKLLRSIEIEDLIARRKIGFYVKMFLLFCVFGFWMFEGNKIYQGYESSNWKKTEAIITKSSFYRSGSGKNNQVPDMGYKYEFNGKGHTGTKLFIRPTDFTKKLSIEDLVELHPVNSKVEIFVCENDPAKSVIYPGVAKSYVLMSIVISIIVTIVFLVPVHLLNKEKKELDFVLREKGHLY